MGAKQRAQNRAKKAAKGSMKGQPMSQKNLNKSISVPDLKSSSRASALQGWNTFASASPSNHNGFSMTEEARNTDKRGFGWSSTPLRHAGIRFVSAGNLKREEDAWNTVSEGDSPPKQSDGEQLSQPVLGEKEVIPPPIPESAEAQETTIERVNDEEQTLSQPVQDTSNEIPSQTTVIAEVRPPTPGSDSEEEIVFTGRQMSKQPSRRPSPAPPPSTVQPETKAKPIASVENIPEPKQNPEQPIPRFSSITLGLDSPVEKPSKSQKKPGRENGLSYGRKYTEDELMQDYIENMALNDDDEEDDESEEGPNGATGKSYRKTTTYRLFAGDGLENAKVQTISAGTDRRSMNLPDQAFDWDSDDLEVFDDASTTDEDIENVGQVLRHREHSSGPQYLVLAGGLDVSQAKWVLHSRLVSKSAVEEIKIYEEIRAMNIQEDEDDDDEDDDDDDSDEIDEEALDDLIGDIESEDDENARIMSYTAAMSDEQIARALAKQEELGLGSDELILLDGEAAGNGDEFLGDPFGVNSSFIPFSLSKHTSNRGRSKRNRKKRDSFPPAEAFADALEQDPYGAFDIMDFDRPSLRPKKKGRKSDYPFDLEGLEDEDLRDNLINTWTKDREKKAARKQEREEARLKASLDMADGSDPALIKHRVRQFLINDADVLELTPMEAPVRAAVHRLAKALKLNSASRGKEGLGMGRYPVLTKTPFTPAYTAETIWQIDALMNTRKFFPKNLYKSYKSSRQTISTVKSRRGGGGVTSGVRFMDGEVVAASAPEIGADNRGRAMLEKMGWVAGTGIGAVGNKGMLDPIRHTIKTGKAGLG